MIRSIRGQTILVTDTSLVIETGGIGYEVLATKADLFGKEPGETIQLWISPVYREDSQELIGFADFADVRFFELLCTVSGIGPKTALSIMDRGSRVTLSRAIGREDAATLAALAGCGKKTAEKIVLSLKDKVISEGEGSHHEKNLIEALEGLGFARREVTSILPSLSAHDSLEDMIREALQLLGKNV